MNYRIVAHPPTAEMQDAVRRMQFYPRRTPDGIFDAMLAASPQPDTVLTDEEIGDMATKAFCDYMRDANDDADIALARAVEAAVLKKLRGEM